MQDEEEKIEQKLEITGLLGTIANATALIRPCRKPLFLAVMCVVFPTLSVLMVLATMVEQPFLQSAIFNDNKNHSYHLSESNDKSLRSYALYKSVVALPVMATWATSQWALVYALKSQSETEWATLLTAFSKAAATFLCWLLIFAGLCLAAVCMIVALKHGFLALGFQSIDSDRYSANSMKLFMSLGVVGIFPIWDLGCVVCVFEEKDAISAVKRASVLLSDNRCVAAFLSSVFHLLPGIIESVSLQWAFRDGIIRRWVVSVLAGAVAVVDINSAMMVLQALLQIQFYSACVSNILWYL